MPGSIVQAAKLFVSLLLPFASATNILIVGDSMGSAMGENMLETMCIGSNVCNAAISGTTAAQWAGYNSNKVRKCNGDWDVVYISVGGNDSLQSDCSMSSTVLAANIQAAVTNIMTNVAPGASKYLLTGYCIPSSITSSGCASPSKIMAMTDALASIDTANGTVEVIDSFSVCGGSLTSFSNKMYFEDAIHLNENGYCKVFTQPDVQSSLICDEITSMNCDTLEVIPKTEFPTETPTKAPTKAPTIIPTIIPTKSMTKSPTKSPTKLLIKPSIKSRTKSPTKSPTKDVGTTKSLVDAASEAPTVTLDDKRSGSSVIVPSIILKTLIFLVVFFT